MQKFLKNVKKNKLKWRFSKGEKKKRKNSCIVRFELLNMDGNNHQQNISCTIEHGLMKREENKERKKELQLGFRKRKKKELSTCFYLYLITCFNKTC